MFACLFACDELTASLWRVDRVTSWLSPGLYRVMCGPVKVMCGTVMPINLWCAVMCGDVRFSGTPGHRQWHSQKFSTGSALICSIRQIFRIGTVRYAEGLWRVRRHGPVIAYCTDLEDFPSILSYPSLLSCLTKSALSKRHDMNRLYEQLHVTGHWP